MNANLIKDFINNFYGYGNLDSKIYFIGKEEGGVTNIKQLEDRIQAWKKLGSKKTVDMAEFHKLIGEKYYFMDSHENDFQLQNTWWRYSYIYHSFLYKSAPTRESYKYIQSKKLGRMDGLGALIELKPLPSKNEKIWPYGGLNIGFLRSRSVYESFIFEKRVSDIKEMINRFKPRLVVFNGKNKNDKIVSYWERIAGTKFHKHEDFDLLIGNNDQTIFIISKQMASGQITNQQLFNIGLYAARCVL